MQEPVIRRTLLVIGAAVLSLVASPSPAADIGATPLPDTMLAVAFDRGGGPEVLSVHRIGFRELCRSDSPRFVSIPESDRPVVQVPIGGDLIHAPTGAVLLQFRRIAIEGGYERVSDYEQPVFAWR